MSSILCRKRGELSCNSFQRYINLRVDFVDGVKKFTPSPVVLPALAVESSVNVNALTNRVRVPLRGRINVDAVDLPSVIENFKS